MIVLVIGGSGSGKSEYAENLAVSLDSKEKLYIATMYPWDQESKERIIKHRKMREKKAFQTKECFYALDEMMRENDFTQIDTAFLDCMSNLVANEMYCEQGLIAKKNCGIQVEKLVDYIMQGIHHLIETFTHVVIVSNDIFTDGAMYGEEMQLYLQVIAKLNTKIAELADSVVEVVCGIPIIQKGKESGGEK